MEVEATMMHKYTTSRLRLSADARSSPDEYLHTDTKKRPREILFFNTRDCLGS